MLAASVVVGTVFVAWLGISSVSVTKVLYSGGPVSLRTSVVVGSRSVPVSVGPITGVATGRDASMREVVSTGVVGDLEISPSACVSCLFVNTVPSEIPVGHQFRRRIACQGLHIPSCASGRMTS